MGFDKATADKDYSGRIETYDGVAAGLRPLDGDGTLRRSTRAAGVLLAKVPPVAA